MEILTKRRPIDLKIASDGFKWKFEQRGFKKSGFFAKKTELLRREGVEPPPTGWKPVILPLNYRRLGNFNVNHFIFRNLSIAQGSSPRKLLIEIFKKNLENLDQVSEQTTPVDGCFPPSFFVHLVNSHSTMYDVTRNSFPAPNSRSHQIIPLHGSLATCSWVCVLSLQR